MPISLVKGKPSNKKIQKKMHKNCDVIKKIKKERNNSNNCEENIYT